MRIFKDTKGTRNRRYRPYGKLPSDSLYSDMLENAHDYVKRLSKFPEVIGITLSGGLSRGYADGLSEIDLNVYLTPEACIEWSMGKGPIPHGDHLGTKYHMDVSFLNLEKEYESNWNLLKKWDTSYTKILYDPLGKLEALFENKDVFTAEEKYSLALTNYLDCVYFADIVVRQWTLRKDPMVANQMISKAIPSLCNLLFLANDEYPPFEKWLVNYSYSLEWKPVNWESRLRELTLIKEISLKAAEKRSKDLMKLYHEVWGKIVGEEYSETGLIELDAYNTLTYVIENSPPVTDFIEKFGAQQLGYEVLFKLANIEKSGDLEIIVFNWDKFLQERELGFPSFLNWNTEMLSHVNLTQS